jgi:hypothetical protein
MPSNLLQSSVSNQSRDSINRISLAGDLLADHVNATLSSNTSKRNSLLLNADTTHHYQQPGANFHHRLSDLKEVNEAALAALSVNHASHIGMPPQSQAQKSRNVASTNKTNLKPVSH